MTAVAITFIALTGLVVLIWLSRHLLIAEERRKGFLLTPDCPGPPGIPPRVSVMIAARDEADCIETCVRTMLDQDYPNYEVVVCNDRSTDATGRVVRALAEEDDRLRLIDIDHLADGWCGKNHAMQHGIATTDSEWVCMIDADCRQISRRTLSTAVQYALDMKADLLSVLPRLEMNSFWENVVQPVCSGVMMIWFNPDKVNDPEKPNAYANGAFILIRRSTYEAIGTHEAVKACLNEDMHMARRVKEAGLALRVARSDGLYLVRMYTSLRQILRGWSRIFYGTFGTLRRLTASLAVLVVVGLLPWASSAIGLAAALAGGQPPWAWWALAGVGGVAGAMQISVIYRFYRLIGARYDLAWTYPLGCIVAIAAVIGSLTRLRSGAKVVWKNTSYSRGQ